jgi:hypothetical protein
VELDLSVPLQHQESSTQEDERKCAAEQWAQVVLRVSWRFRFRLVLQHSRDWNLTGRIVRRRENCNKGILEEMSAESRLNREISCCSGSTEGITRSYGLLRGQGFCWRHVYNRLCLSRSNLWPTRSSLKCQSRSAMVASVAKAAASAIWQSLR